MNLLDLVVVIHKSSDKLQAIRVILGPGKLVRMPSKVDVERWHEERVG